MRTFGGIFRRGDDAGDHELEADVMRFVAILALCIVAISTLVDEAAAPVSAAPSESPIEAAPAAPAQSTPLMVPAPPVPPSASARTGGAEPITSSRTPPAIRRLATTRPRAVVVQDLPPQPRPSASLTESAAPRSRGVKAPVATQPPRVLPGESPGESPRQPPEDPSAETSARPTTAAVPTPSRTAAARTGVSSPKRPPASPSEPRKGFTLRFASDAALLRLVARGAADVFVFDGPETLRLSYGPGGPDFDAAPGPGQFHAIAASTVPALLQRVLVLDGRDPATVVWGVTLPDTTRADLSRLISEYEAGELVIDERGGIAMEKNHG